MKMNAQLIMICYYRGNGGWDSTNLVIAEESQDGHITCHSFHLTCFAVLADFSDISEIPVVSNISRRLEKQVCAYSYSMHSD